MLAFSPSLFLPYLILCSVLMVLLNIIIYTAVFDFKFKRRPSQKVLLSKLPSTDSLSNSPAPSSPGEVIKIMHRSLRYHIDLTSMVFPYMYHCISPDQQTHLILDHSILHDHYKIFTAFTIIIIIVIMIMRDL